MLTRKQQQQRKQQKQREDAAKAKLAKQLGRAPDGSLPKGARKPKDDGSSLKIDYRTSDTKHIPSAEQLATDEQCDFLPEVEGWEERERAAAEEIERKKKRTAPLYNKGGYQYISDGEDPTTLGRKV
jgi:hypothetical protein